MIDPRSSALFAVRELQGIETAVLDDRSIQTSRWFDHVVPDVVVEGRFLPLYATGADRGCDVVVADLLEDELRRVAPAHSGGTSPTVDREAGRILVATDDSVRTVAVDGSDSRTLGEIYPEESTIKKGKERRSRVAAGLTQSVDGELIGIGYEDDETAWVGSLDRATGTATSWHERSRQVTTVRFSPTDPSLLLFVLDADPAAVNSSMPSAWLARKGLGARPLDGLLPDRHHGHWWDPDGTGLWYVDPGTGVAYLDLELGRRETVWSGASRLAHATADGRLVAATVERDGARSVRVYDRNSDASLTVAAGGTSTDYERSQPQFVADDEFLVHTVSTGDDPTLALTPVDAIRKRL